MNTAGKSTLTFGMVSLPVKLGKAEADGGVDTTTLCDCGGSIGPLSDDEGNKVACKECEERYSWYNSAPAKGYEAGDVMVELDADEVEEARSDVPVDVGEIEKVVPVKAALLEYAVTGNYYVVPEEGFGEQYATIERVLDREDRALLTYLDIGKTRRYAIIAEGGVLIALQLADKRPLDEPVNFDADDAMVEQAAGLLEGQYADDPALEDVADVGLKQLIREKAAADNDEPEPEPEPAPTPTPEPNTGESADADDDDQDDAEAEAETGLAQFS